VPSESEDVQRSAQFGVFFSNGGKVKLGRQPMALEE
jgi:hypothetical protein